VVHNTAAGLSSAEDQHTRLVMALHSVGAIAAIAKVARNGSDQGRHCGVMALCRLCGCHSDGSGEDQVDAAVLSELLSQGATEL
jgi:hypothetical protein